MALNAGSSANVPVTLNASGALFFPDVWLSVDLDGAAARHHRRLHRRRRRLPRSQRTAPTRTLAVSVDAEVPDGLYPIVVAGYNGEVKTTLTLQVVVGEGPANRLYLPLATR